MKKLTHILESIVEEKRVDSIKTNEQFLLYVTEQLSLDACYSSEDSTCLANNILSSCNNNIYESVQQFKLFNNK